VLVSVKYTSKSYDSPPNSIFKVHFKDLAQTVACFSKSSLRDENNKAFESGIRKSNDTGVLFWITGDIDSDQDIANRVSGVVLDKSLEFSNIQIVDSARAAFIYNTVKFAESYGKNNQPLWTESP